MFGLTTIRRLRAVETAARSEQERLRIRAERAESRAKTAEYNREQLLRQLAEADAANRRLHGRVEELGRRNAALAESDLEYAAQLEQRLRRALRGCARWMDATWVEVRHRDHLQQRLDDAVGLSTTIVDSGRWQPGYKPAPTPEVAS